MAIGTNPMPSESTGMPKVKRVHPRIGVGADEPEQQAEEHHGDGLE